MYPNAAQIFEASRRRPTNGNPNVGEPDPLTADEKSALDDGKAWVAAHGVIYYADIFDTAHWVKFCFWIDLKVGNYSSRSCVAYNNSDDE